LVVSDDDVDHSWNAFRFRSALLFQWGPNSTSTAIYRNLPGTEV